MISFFRIILTFASSFLLFISCNNANVSKSKPNLDANIVQDSLFYENKIDTIAPNPLSEIEKTFINHDLVDVQTLDHSIFVDLKYASTDNFLDTNIYGNIAKAYLQKDVAQKLAKASEYLQEACDSCRLLIFDAARPQSVQYKMWKKIKSMPVQQGVYVSNPDKGSVHNFGAAVDLTIITINGKELDMGTPFDYFGKEAWTTNEDSLVRIQKLTKEQVENRLLLRKAMRKAGFSSIPSEWWHFNAYSRSKAQQIYTIIK